jgi:hypothetical protein
MPTLDSQTIIVVSMAQYYLLAVLTTFFSRSLRNYPGPTHWAAMAWGWALLSVFYLLQGRATPWLSVIMPNLGHIAATCLLSQGLARFVGAPTRWRYNGALWLASLAGFVYFTFFQDSFPGRVTIISLAYALILGDAVRLLAGYRAGPHDAGRKLALVCCLGSLAVYLARSVLVWLYPAQNLAVGHALTTTWSLLFFPLSVMAIVLSLVSLAAARFAHEAEQSQAESANANRQLQEALDNVRTLRGLLPICSKCKKIRDKQGRWQVMETYIQRNSEASFTHGLCQECMREVYPDLVDKDD